MFRGLDIPREDKISVITLLLWDAVWTCFLIAMLLHLTGVVDIPAFGGGGEQLFEPIDMGLCIGGALTACINYLMAQRLSYEDDFSLKVSTKTYYIVYTVAAAAALAVAALIVAICGRVGALIYAPAAVSVVAIAGFIAMTACAVRNKRREQEGDGAPPPDRDLPHDGIKPLPHQRLIFLLLAYDVLWLAATVVLGGYELEYSRYGEPDMISIAVLPMSMLTLLLNFGLYAFCFSNAKEDIPPFSAKALRNAGLVALGLVMVMYTIDRNFDLPNMAWTYMVLPIPGMLLLAYVSIRVLAHRRRGGG